MGRVLAISSHVARGHVGLAATVPALQSFGHEVWAVPTVILASRPGLGQLLKYPLPVVELAAMLAALEADGAWSLVDAVFAGYFPSPQSVSVAAQAISRAKQARPDLIVLVDPILGDADRLYVAPETAAALRDELLPLATLATPNLFELAWLTGRAPGSIAELAEVAAAARCLRLPSVVVTSARVMPAGIATVLVSADASLERVMPRRAGIPNGAGDLFAGLLLGRLLNGELAADALRHGLADLDLVLAASEHRSCLELAALLTRSPPLG